MNLALAPEGFLSNAQSCEPVAQHHSQRSTRIVECVPLLSNARARVFDRGEANMRCRLGPPSWASLRQIWHECASKLQNKPCKRNKTRRHVRNISTSAREHCFAPANKMRSLIFRKPHHLSINVLTALVRNCAFLFRRHPPFQHSIGLTHCKDRTGTCPTIPYVTADGHGPELHTYSY